MGDGFFYKLKTLIGIEEIEEEDRLDEKTPASSSLERQQVDPRGAYATARNHNKGLNKKEP
jgi:hypothetical protein